MDIQKVFRGISNKLLNDFELSSQIDHSGNKGDYRENALKKFLSEGRLPKRYGIGNGEIVGHISNVSKQSDLIIYDQLNNIPLLYDEKIQVYPIDCIYGTIEVKSKLSKSKLIESLENIKSVKELTPNDVIMKKNMFISQTYKRPKPFGIIFAYSLSNNSLDSLVENLKEWEEKNNPDYWPNLIVVLGEGIIFHNKMNSFDKSIKSELIKKDTYPSSLRFRNDSFFHFYSYLIELCNSIELPEIQLSKFLNLAIKQDEFVVKNNDRIVMLDKEDNCVYRLNSEFIRKLVNWCKGKGSVSKREYYLNQFGQLPLGIDNFDNLDTEVYLYNPKERLGMHEVKDSIKFDSNKRPVVDPRVIIASSWIEVNGEVFYYSFDDVTENDYEVIPGKTRDDL